MINNIRLLAFACLGFALGESHKANQPQIFGLILAGATALVITDFIQELKNPKP